MSRLVQQGTKGGGQTFRQGICAEFPAIGRLPNVKVWASHGNFVLLQVPDNLACMAAAAKAGIILRDQSKQKALPRCVRVTIGSEEEMKRFCEESEKILAGNKKTF